MRQKIFAGIELRKNVAKIAVTVKCMMTANYLKASSVSSCATKILHCRSELQLFMQFDTKPGHKKLYKYDQLQSIETLFNSVDRQLAVF
jgi:hypothetical protein